MKRLLTVLAAGGTLALASVAVPGAANARCIGCGVAAGVLGGVVAGAAIAGAFDGPYYGYGGPYAYYGAGPYAPYGGYDGPESRAYYYGNRDHVFYGPPGSCADRTANSRQLQGTC